MRRATWRSLLARKARLLLSTFAIVLGVAFVAGSLIFTDTLERSFTAVFSATVGDVVVSPEGGTSAEGSPTARTVGADLVEELAEVDGAAGAEGHVDAVGVFVVDREGEAVGGFGPPGLGTNYTSGPAADGQTGLTLVAGRAPSGDDELALDERAAEVAGYEIGDEVPVVTASPQTPRLTGELVGLLGFPDGGSTNGATIVALDTPTAQQVFLGGQDAFNSIWVTAADGVSQAELASSVREVLPSGVLARTGEVAADEDASDLLTAISFITTFLLVFAGIALLVGSFLIVNTFSMLVAQRARELALLRALGASRGQVTRSVLTEAVILGVLGSTLGLALGLGLAFALRALFGQFGLDLSGQPLVFSATTVVAAYAVGVLVTLVAAYLPARRAGRTAPVAVMREGTGGSERGLGRRAVLGVVAAVAGVAALVTGLVAPVPGLIWWIGLGALSALLGVAAASPVLGRPVLAASGALSTRLFGAPGRLAAQNAQRNPRRTAATASALMIGLALVTTLATAGASAKGSVDQVIEESFAGDAVISNITNQPFSPEIARQARELPQVEEVTALQFVFAREGESRVGVIGADVDGLVEAVSLEVVEGSAQDLDAGTMLLAVDQARSDGVGIGDELTYETPEGDRSWRVVGLFERNPLLGFPRVVSLGTLVDSGWQRTDSLVVVTRAVGAPQRAMLRGLEDIVADQPTVTVKDQAGFAEEQRGPIDQLLLLVYALLGLALVIAALGVVNTLALAVVERTREVGLLRAVGLSRRQLRGMVALESMAIALLGAVLGVALGLLFGVALMRSLRDQGLEVVTVPVGQLVLFVVVALVVGLLASVLPARRAARMDVLEAIGSA
ncbi:ABC transporter permease [Nocardioidaceae bacterium]|nr:ABC transporter permease [Nocardioidaceae bacterium]